MDPASARYLIRFKGHLGATLLSAFPAMAWQWQGPETVLTGVLDRPGFHGVLATMKIPNFGARSANRGSDGRMTSAPIRDPDGMLAEFVEISGGTA